MSSRYICNWDEVPELKTLDSVLNDAVEDVKIKHMFLQKQMDSYAREYDKLKKEQWDGVEKILEERGLVVNYNGNTHNLRLERETGQLFLEPNDSKEGMPPGLKSLIDAITKK